MTLRLLVAPKGGRETASSRYRVHDLVPLLTARGWEVDLLTPSRQRGRRAWSAARDAVKAVNRSDVLLVQRPGRRREELFLLRLAAARSRVVAIDVDDPMAEHGVSGWAVKRAQVALVGSHGLARRYTGRIPVVEVVPTPIEPKLYDVPRPVNAPPVIGWIGLGPSYREPLARMVAAVGIAAPGAWRVRVVGTAGDTALAGVLRAAAGDAPIEIIDDVAWEDEDAVARTVAMFDVGLAPFRDAEGASFKTIQYLAAGVVPLVEAGGEAERHARKALGDDAIVVSPGRVDQVASALARLSDPTARAALAERGREAARHLFSADQVVRRIDGVLRKALEIA